MQVGIVMPSPPVTQADRLAAREDASAQIRAASAQPEPKAPFQPAPAIRPTVQDRIAIDQTLLALREF